MWNSSNKEIIYLSHRKWQFKNRFYRLIHYLRLNKINKSFSNFIDKLFYNDNCLYNHYSYIQDNLYHRRFASVELWKKVKKLYGLIKCKKYFQECSFPEECLLVSPVYKKRLDINDFNKEEKKIIRDQIIKAVKTLNDSRLAHRDLHTGNIFFENNAIKIVDLEFLEVNDANLRNCYDLTGEGLQSPLRSGNMNLFSNSKNSVSNNFDINIIDFFNED